MAVDPDSAVESLNVLEDQPVCLVMRLNPEAVQPFPLDQGVEGFDTGVIVGIALVAVLSLLDTRQGGYLIYDPGDRESELIAAISFLRRRGCLRFSDDGGFWRLSSAARFR